MTLYLKYRPQKIADLDLKEVRDMLGKIIGSKSLPHAFLFTGPRGTGKTSSARILAKAINCPKTKTGEPCNECEVCLDITAGQAPDVLEIDAASNRGIDEIRTLRDNIKLSPLAFKYKVYIIDEVHMLTTEAANALLKTLEEPPAHAVFVLCTTDPQRLPETVVSRCMQVNFKMPQSKEVVDRLEKIAKAEKIKTEDSALQLIALAGGGSFRDSVKTLEQIWLSTGDASEESTRQTLGLLENSSPAIFWQKWSQGDVEACLKFIQGLVDNGIDIRSFIERLMELLRQELLTTKSREIITKIEKLDVAYEQTKTAVISQLPLEMMVIDGFATIPVIHSKEGKEEKEEKKIEKQVEPEKPVVKKTETKYQLEDLKAKWSDILKSVKPKNHSVEALLRSTSPVEFDGEDLVLEVFYKFHKDKLESEKCRVIVEEAVGNLFAVPQVRLKLKLGSKHKEEVSAQGVEEDIIAAAAEIFKVETV